MTTSLVQKRGKTQQNKQPYRRNIHCQGVLKVFFKHCFKMLNLLCWVV